MKMNVTLLGAFYASTKYLLIPELKKMKGVKEPRDRNIHLFFRLKERPLATDIFVKIK